MQPLDLRFINTFNSFATLEEGTCIIINDDDAPEVRQTSKNGISSAVSYAASLIVSSDQQKLADNQRVIKVGLAIQKFYAAHIEQNLKALETPQLEQLRWSLTVMTKRYDRLIPSKEYKFGAYMLGVQASIGDRTASREKEISAVVDKERATIQKERAAIQKEREEMRKEAEMRSESFAATIKSNVDSVRDALNKEKTENWRLRKDVSDLTERLSAANDKASDKERRTFSAESALRHAQAQLKEAEAAMQTTRAHDAKTQLALRQQVAALTKQNEQQATQAASDKTEIAKAWKITETNRAHEVAVKQENFQLSGTVKHLESTISCWETQYQKDQNVLAESEAQKAALQVQVKQLEAAVQNWKDEHMKLNSKVENDLRRADRRVHESEAREKVLQTQIDKLMQQLRKQEQASNSAQPKVQQLQGEADDIQPGSEGLVERNAPASDLDAINILLNEGQLKESVLSEVDRKVDHALNVSSVEGAVAGPEDDVPKAAPKPIASVSAS